MIVLDTHVWVWLISEPRRLSPAAQDAIRRAVGDRGLAIASISLWEVAMMMARGTLLARGTPEASLRAMVDRSRVTIRDISPDIAALATHLPADFPRDPADRLIAATARAEGVPLVTRDERLRASPVIETIW